MIIFCFFSAFTAATLFSSERSKVLARSREEWLLDSLGLIMQGVAIPALQIVLSQKIYATLFPLLKGSLTITAAPAFLLNFVAVDYVYYWNHRLLHHAVLWPVHLVHHGALRFDFLMSSRNTAWSPFFIAYLWVNGFFIYVLRDSSAFILGAAITAGLDLWRHTCFGPKFGGFFYSILSPFLILPQDHAVHHGRDVCNVNYGANLNL